MSFNDLREEFAENLKIGNKIKTLCAKDATIKPILLYENDNVTKILKKLKKESINACVVVSKDKKFIGMINDNDIIRLFLQQVKNEPLVKHLNHGYRREFLYKTAKDMINKNKITVKIRTPINEIIKLIFKQCSDYIPVLDNNDKVIGIVTPSSIINLLKDY